jgi:ABC-type branched-subunit amino acid transport system permease subunit
MKVTTKAVLYSLLVFPGAGYFTVKQRLKGFTCMGATLACIAAIMQDVFYKAQIIADKITKGEIPLDLFIIREQIDATTGVFSPSTITALYLTLVMIWLAGILDSYRLGRKLERDKQPDKHKMKIH